MSTYYFIYTEVNINGKWICIDGKVPCIEKNGSGVFNDNNVEYELKEAYWSGSQSYFGKAYDKLFDWGERVNFKDLSQELKDEWKEALEYELKEEYVEFPLVVDYEIIDKGIDYCKFDYHGPVHKDKIFSFESGEIDEIWSDETDFSKLSDIEKMSYQYYEWDSCEGWNGPLKEVKRCVEREINRFRSGNYIWNDTLEYRIVVITA